jgi:large subunit ribosomal protein L22
MKKSPKFRQTFLEASSSQRYIIMSHRKLRRVVNVIRGKHAVEALNILRLMPYDAATVVLKKLVEAIYNAKQKYDVSPSSLVVSQVFVDEGPAYKRFKPRAQGRMYKREKPTAHLTLTVSVFTDANETEQVKQENVA